MRSLLIQCEAQIAGSRLQWVICIQKAWKEENWIFCVVGWRAEWKKWKRRGFKGESEKICLCCIQYKITQGKQTRTAEKQRWDVWKGHGLNAQAKAEIMTWDWSCGDGQDARVENCFSSHLWLFLTHNICVYFPQSLLYST